MGAFLGALSVDSAPSHAATIPVFSTADDANLGPNGNCTLREAITAANLDVRVDKCPPGSGADVITLPAGTYTLTIPGAAEDANATGDLDITSDVTLVGAGAGASILRGDPSVPTARDRVLHVVGQPTVTIRDLTLADGNLETPTSIGTDVGGNLRVDGGVVTLERTTVRDGVCSAWVPYAFCSGGGVGVLGGQVTLTDVSISGNQATNAGGGIELVGGTMIVHRTVVRANSDYNSGGGIQVEMGASLEIHESAVVMNTAFGASIHQYDYGSHGGGIWNLGTTWIESSTIAGNTAYAGIFMPSEPSGGVGTTGTLVVRDSTIAGNRMGASATVPNPTVGGIGVEGAGTARIHNTVLADPCHGSSFTSDGYNIEAGDTCGLGQPSDLPDTDPHASPVAVPSGTTWVIALALGSPALDSGDAATCPATDQRGAPRPVDGDGDGTATCDRGAVEQAFGPDSDGDELVDDLDNCPSVANAEQADRDRDGIGDLCDPCEDLDADGYGDPASNGCPHPERDCVDAYDFVNRGMTEVVANHFDDDCNPATPDCPDADGDHYFPLAFCGGLVDCDDTNANVHPLATEIPGNGIDDDCNPSTPAGTCSSVAADGSASAPSSEAVPVLFAAVLLANLRRLGTARGRGQRRGRR